MKKTIINVYKHQGAWRRDPPGIGDYLRGCCYLQYKARVTGTFEAKFNLSLSPASRYLAYESVFFPGDPQVLADAKEYFEVRLDGDVDQVIESFLRSPQETLYVSTNRSWRGLDDLPERVDLETVAKILQFTPEFERLLAEKFRALPRPYTLLHVRDTDRKRKTDRWWGAKLWDEWQFRRRAEQFIETEVKRHALSGAPIVCMSNNVRLRDHLCRKYGYIDLRNDVQNTGHQGILSEAELIDLALIKNAATLLTLSYFAWSSGFSVWATRIFSVRAFFYNATSVFTSDLRLRWRAWRARMSARPGLLGRGRG